MQISFDIPDQIGVDLEADCGSLAESAREAFVIENYRTGRISLGSVAAILGLETRIEAQDWLARHGAPLNYDLEALNEDRQTLAKLFNVKL